MTKLEVKNITKRFKTIHGTDTISFNAIENICLSIEEGEFVCFVGPSGCGKSTLLNILAGLDKPTEGEIILNGQPVSETGPDRIMVFQENALFPWLKVIDNVEFGLKMAGIQKDKRHAIAIHYLDMMQLTKFAEAFTYQLSGGMKQKLGLACALIHRERARRPRSEDDDRRPLFLLAPLHGGGQGNRRRRARH